MWRGKFVVVCGLALVILAGVSAPARADTSSVNVSFAFTSIDAPCAACPGGIAKQTAVNGINAAGEMVGAYTDNLGHQHGFLLSRGHFTTIDVPGALATAARGIGPGGTIVGNYKAAPGDSLSDVKGFVDRLGTFTTVTFPDHPGAIVQRIGPDGTMFGCFHDTDFGKSMFSAVFSRFGDTSLAAGGGELADPTASFPISMHTGATPDGSMVVGLYTDAGGHQHGYMVMGGSLTAYDVPGSTQTAIWDINASAAFVGGFVDANGAHGFLQAGMGSAPLTIDFPGAKATTVFTINAAGTLAGQYKDANGMIHGFVAVEVSED